MQYMSSILLLTLTLLGSRAAFAENSAVRGEIDLQSVDWQGPEIIDLRGDWRFYWNQLLSPEDLQEDLGQLTAYVPMEAGWRKPELAQLDLPRLGSATYQLKLKLAPLKTFGLMIPAINSASRVWIDKLLVQDYGKVTLNPDEAEGFVKKNYIQFVSGAVETTITVQVSNHQFFYGGVWLPLRIGLPEHINEERIQYVVQDALSYGMILFMAFYHVYIWIILRRSFGPLLFGLFCFSIIMRSSVVGDGQVLHTIFPSIPLKLHFFMEYFGLASSAGLILSFMRDLYPRETSRFLYYPLMFLSVAWSLSILVLTPRIYASFLESFQLVIFAVGLLTLGTLALALKRKRDGARLYMSSAFFLFFTVGHDISLSKRMVESVPLVQFGVLVLLLTQAFLLARRFVHSFERAEQAEQTVKVLNNDLEKKVESRTEQINTILRHAQSGFLLIDREGSIQNGFTSSCESILGIKLKPGQAFQEVLKGSVHLPIQFTLAVEQIFAGTLPAEVAMQQLPSRFPSDNRIIGLQGAAVRDPSTEAVLSILLTINDVTDLVAAEEGLKRSGILIHILEDQNAFRIFLADFKSDVEAAMIAVQKNNSPTLQSLIHTMKGNVASFNLQELVDLIHQVEDRVEISVHDVQKISQFMRDFLQNYQAILHVDYEQPDRGVFNVVQQDLQELQESLQPVASAPVMERLQLWMQTITFLPVLSYTTPLVPMVKRVAEQLQKKVVLKIEGAELKVHPAYGRLLTTLTHMVRNALVHGIEYPDERQEKPEQGTITMKFSQMKDGGLQIIVLDDGQGLNTEKIMSHARKQGITVGEGTHDESSLFALIFHPSFSTADQVSDLAGRGMGLAAVASAAKELGGRFEVASRKGEGTRFTIVLPAPQRNLTQLSAAV